MAARKSRPTAEALAKHPLAIVILTADRAKPEKIDFDFEWFDSDAGLQAYLTALNEWAKDDAAANKDALFLHAVVTDTSALTVSEVHLIGPDDLSDAEKDSLRAWGDAAKAKPADTLLQGGAPAAPKQTTVKPKVKPRKASTAAAAIKAAQAGTAKPEDKAEALKAKLAEKRAARQKPQAAAEAKPEVKASVPEPKAEAAAASVMALAWAVPLGRRANGRFAKIR